MKTADEVFRVPVNILTNKSLQAQHPDDLDSSENLLKELHRSI